VWNCFGKNNVFFSCKDGRLAEDTTSAVANISIDITDSAHALLKLLAAVPSIFLKRGFVSDLKPVNISLSRITSLVNSVFLAISVLGKNRKISKLEDV
jgi:hypothetical protein